MNNGANRDIFYKNLIYDKDVVKYGKDNVIPRVKAMEDMTERYIVHYNHIIDNLARHFVTKGVEFPKEEVPRINVIDSDDILEFSKRASVGYFKSTTIDRLRNINSLQDELDEITEMYDEFVSKGSITDKIKDQWCNYFLDAINEVAKTPEVYFSKEESEASDILAQGVFYSLFTYAEYASLAKSHQIILDYYESEDSIGEILSGVRLKRGEIWFLADLFETNANILAYSFFIGYRLLKETVGIDISEIDYLNNYQMKRDNNILLKSLEGRLN